VFEVGQHGLVAKLPVASVISAIDIFDSPAPAARGLPTINNKL